MPVSVVQKSGGLLLCYKSEERYCEQAQESAEQDAVCRKLRFAVVYLRKPHYDGRARHSRQDEHTYLERLGQREKIHRKIAEQREQNELSRADEVNERS